MGDGPDRDFDADRDPDSSPTATASPSGMATTGGLVIIGIPAAAPVLCSPSPVTVPVGQRALIDCTAQGYGGPLTWTLSDAAVASVQLATGTYTFFYVSGIQTGTTTLSLRYQTGGAGSVAITVVP